MSDQRMIGDILQERRERLGLSVDRVVSDTKLQRRLIEAFERSDFDAMPPRGYAQATLASYARYLDLDPEPLLRAYESQLYHHQREQRGTARTESRASTSSSRASRSQRDDYRSTSTARRGYASEDSSDRSRASGRASGSTAASYNRASSARRDARGTSYVSDLYSAPMSSTSLYESSRSSRYREEIGATSRDYAYERSDRSAAGRDSLYGSSSRTQQRTRASKEEQPVRRTAGVVTLDDGYQGGSGGRSRQGASGRDPRDDEMLDTLASIRSSLSGVMGGIANYLRTNKNAAFFVAAMALLLVIVLIIFGVTSCASRRAPIATEQGTSTGTTAAQSSSADGDSSSTNQVVSEVLTNTIDLTNLPASSTIEFKVSDTATSSPWIEATVDGSRVYADNAAPGSVGTYVVTVGATIIASDPDAVTFTVNGTQVQPTISNRSATLTVSVAADQQGAATDNADEGTDGAEDQSGEDTGEDGSDEWTDDGSGDYTEYTDEGDWTADSDGDGYSDAYTGDHTADVAGSVQVLYDENGQGYYIDANGDVNYYYDDGTPVT